MSQIVLKQGQSYSLKHTSQFCHTVGEKGYNRFSKNMNSWDRLQATFVGTVTSEQGTRNIFFNDKHDDSQKRMYIMFGADNVDYIDEKG